MSDKTTVFVVENIPRLLKSGTIAKKSKYLMPLSNRCG